MQINQLKWDKIKLTDEKCRFVSYFDPDSGFYMRTGVLDKCGNDTDVDPFMASYPQLLDIGIMGHCIHGLSGQCKTTGIQCYQNGAHVKQPNMTFDNFRRIVDESRGKVFQFALGGRGDPELHEDFEKILAYSREKGIVPNITTSGFLLTKEKAKIIKKYCGAAAVSWYKTEYTFKAIDILLNEGVKTNIHFVLGRNSLEEAIGILENQTLPKGINRIIFLLFKPIGQGTSDNILSHQELRTSHFFRLFDTPNGLKTAGFDSCCVPALVNNTKVVDPNCFDTCEGARYSAYITLDMKILPCSFDQEMRWAVDLKTSTIRDAWDSPTFEDFRSRLMKACGKCIKRGLCMGGCPVKPEIVLCGSEFKDNYQ